MSYTVSYLPCKQGRVNTTPLGAANTKLKKRKDGSGVQLSWKKKLADQA